MDRFIFKLNAYIQLMRPHQYLKNGFVWLPLFFGYQLQNPRAVLQTLIGFLSFCAAASAVYIINDLKDIAYDRQHPLKKQRPIASGAVNQSEGFLLVMFFLFLAGLLALLYLPFLFSGVICLYLGLNIAYSHFLKHVAIIDTVCIAIGFVLRIVAGAIAANVMISHWIIIMTYLLALFLALSKRRDDILNADRGLKTRKAINGYSLEFVSLSMCMVASVTTITYLLYTVSPEIIIKHDTHHLYISGLWVILGLLRYMQITFVENRSGSPTLVIIKDYMLQAIVAMWLISLYVILYYFHK